MNVLIVYDSFFGNTEQIALTLRDTLGKEQAKAVRVEAFEPEQLKAIDLLIVGSPTRAFRPTKGITEFIKKLPADGLRGISICAFDTRASLADINSGALKTMVKVFGYAAEPMAKGLIKKGGNQVAEPNGFEVMGEKGPLKDGELDRAIAWASGIYDSIVN